MQAVAPGVKSLFELVARTPSCLPTAISNPRWRAWRARFSPTPPGVSVSERIFVERSIFELRRLKAKTESLKIGWPDEPDVAMGLISREHREKVLSYSGWRWKKAPPW